MPSSGQDRARRHAPGRHEDRSRPGPGQGHRVQARANELQAKIVARVSTLQDDVKAAPEQAKVLPTKAQAKATDMATDVVTAALTAYGDLAGRGKTW